MFFGITTILLYSFNFFFQLKDKSSFGTKQIDLPEDLKFGQVNTNVNTLFIYW